MTLANEHMGNYQVIRVISYHFPNFPIIYLAGIFYYCIGHPSSTILLVSIKFYAGFQNITSEPLEFVYFVDPQVCY